MHKTMADSKTGPTVTSRKQADAIGINQGKKKG